MAIDKPLPPDVLASALQDRVHQDTGRLRIAKSIRVKMWERRLEQANRPLAPAPRYDDVFFDGLEWLDGLE